VILFGYGAVKAPRGVTDHAWGLTRPKSGPDNTELSAEELDTRDLSNGRALLID